MNKLSQIQRAGYYAGYHLNKTATVEKAATPAAAVTAMLAAAGVSRYMIAKIVPWLVLAPVPMGIGLGAAHSKITSPTVLDQTASQKSLELAELDEYAAELRRQAKHAKRKERVKRPTQRSLHL